MKKILFDYDFINPFRYGLELFIAIEITKEYIGFQFIFIRVYLNY